MSFYDPPVYCAGLRNLKYSHYIPKVLGILKKYDNQGRNVKTSINPRHKAAFNIRK